MAKADIGFVVMGLGHIGKRHAEMVLRQNDAHLVAFIDCLSPDSLDLGDLASGIPHFYTFDEFLTPSRLRNSYLTESLTPYDEA